MTDYAELLQPDQGQPARTITVLGRSDFPDWLAAQPERTRAAALAARFEARTGEMLVVPGDGPSEWSVVLGDATEKSVWTLASAAGRLPEGLYRLMGRNSVSMTLGWLLAHYRFERYLSEAEPIPSRVLLTSDPASISEQVHLAEAVALVRDLVNTPAADMGPAELQHEAETIAKQFGAATAVTKGHDLEVGYPMIHAVGQAADKRHAPRLIEIEWGNPAHPRVAIIGKGVSFDSGGLDIKPASGMRIMKKDMGGAAHALALSRLIMQARLPVRLHMLLPAAENAIAGNAFRPGDILRSRLGMTVEVDNTDAEGRLILADALTKAAEAEPVLILDFATLTGAARVALGPDLPALFTNDQSLANELNAASIAEDDPVWQLPLWPAYDDMLKSEIADVANSSEGGMAGAITAALFLRKFVPVGTPWAHLDTWAWRAAAKPGRPKGGEALGLRAAWAVLKARFPSS